MLMRSTVFGKLIVWAFDSREVTVMSEDWQERIVLDPAVLTGKPTVRGMRISVEHVLRALSNGVPQSELLAEYPDLEPEDFHACLAYAADLVESERVYPVGAGVPA